MNDPLPVVTPPCRVAAGLGRAAILALPLGVVLLGMTWGRLAYRGPHRIPDRWGDVALVAVALLVVDWIKSSVRLRGSTAPRLDVLRPALVVAAVAVLLSDPFVDIDDRTDIIIAATVVLPMTLSIWPLVRSGAVLATTSLAAFVASSVASMTYNTYAFRSGVGFFISWIT